MYSKTRAVPSNFNSNLTISTTNNNRCMEVAHRPELRALTSKGVLAKEHFKIINNLEHNLVMGVGSVKEAEVSKPQEWWDPKKRERQFKTNKIITILRESDDDLPFSQNIIPTVFLSYLFILASTISGFPKIRFLLISKLSIPFPIICKTLQLILKIDFVSN